MGFYKKVSRAICFIILLSSCSLDYFEQDDLTSTSPEFVFFDAEFTRVENKKKSITMNVGQLEQYSENGLSFALNPSFTLYDSDENTSVLGSCDLLAVDTKNNEYTFLGNVSIVSHEHNAIIEAENLRWLGDDELFLGALNETVSISIGKSTLENDSNTANETEMIIEGTGFSAKGIDFSYAFEGPVTGRIIEN